MHKLKHVWVKFTEVSCESPPNGIYTELTPQARFLYKDTYNYTCLEGYETENVTNVCLPNGSWSLPEAVICSSKWCSSPVVKAICKSTASYVQCVN